ncbi:DNA recombination protein RmuC [Acidipropionibacterium timonense]|uniref:DNA recombination protein RmuC n=1 Tax=Acidipropionibacterium timonense TaxID=2161818 RepID=UPI001030A151|nr:DNA recombination protein RmuC [Acidipropionibacterium timonense]
MNLSTVLIVLVALACGLVIGWLAATVRAADRAERRRAQDQRELARTHDDLADRFKALSAEALADQDRRAERTTEQTLASTQRILAPVSLALERLDRRLVEVEKERTESTATLREQVSGVAALSEGLRRETASLATALRKPQVRGAWGEMQLRRVVELAGMVEHCDFEEQSTTTVSGASQRPDMTVWMAGDRCVHVDSKTPLAAFLEASAAPDEATREEALERFARHVRTHIDQLSSKRYWATDVASPQFVVLFLPSDAFLQAALDRMPDLHEYAARRDIVLASPAILIPMLRVIALAWRQDAVARSAAEVASLGRELHERLATLAEHLDKLGRSLTGAVRSYNSALGSLETRVLVSARRFEELDVTTSRLTGPAPVDAAVRPLTAPELSSLTGCDAGTEPRHET